MMVWENFKIAFTSIGNAKLRSFLTMLGIIIGIAAVVAISSIGAGLQSQVSSEVNSLGANIVFVLPGQVTGGGGKGLNPSAGVGASTLTLQDVSSIQQIAGVQDLTYFSLLSGVVSHDQTSDGSALLMATTPSFISVLANEKVDQGRFLANGDVNANVAVLGSAARDSLFGKDTNAVGQTVDVRNHSFQVVGVLASTNNGASFGPSLDDAVYLPTGSARSLVGSDLSIARIGVKVDNENDVNPTVDRIKSKIKQNHGGQEDFSVLTQQDLLGTVNSVLGGLTSAIAAIAAIALLVGGIGIMNIMLVSVTERTREIGIRKALGASSRVVLAQFLIEAIVLSLLGGLLGIAGAVALAKFAGHLINIAPVFTAQNIGTAVGVSVAVGVIFGLAPAAKAARKRPIQALRYE